MIIFTCILHITFVHYELTKYISNSQRGLIAQLVEHCTAIAEDRTPFRPELFLGFNFTTA